MKQNILIVDDDKDICSTLSKILSTKGFNVSVANNSDAAINEIKQSSIDLVLLDVWLEGSKKDGLELLKIIKNYNPITPVILISGHANVEMAVKAIKRGAFYFIEKPFKSEQLFLIIDKAIENAFLKNKYEIYKENLEDDEEIIGNTVTIKNLKKKIKQISASNARVLITGDSGTGKNYIAKQIHNFSDRSSKPFISINCALLSDKNFDKSFFGDFTDANKNFGYIQKAAQGTIYLKEICDLEHHIQGKITNFLQKETYSLNSSTGKDDFTTNIRFISSTSKDINLEVEKKRLRKDLLYRLNVATLQIPPIKKRREDIPLLIDYFIKKKEKNNIKIKLSDDVYPLLQTIEWPGNVTQIKNFIEWAHILIKSSNKKIDIITTNMLPNDLITGNNDNNSPDNDKKSIMNLPIKDARKNFEKEYLLNQVNRFGGNISKTANFIGMERSALHRKIKEIGIKK